MVITDNSAILSPETKAFVDENGVVQLSTYFARNYPNNEVLGVVVNAIENVITEKTSPATAAIYGTVKIGYQQTGTKYPVKLSADGQMYVDLPIQNKFDTITIGKTTINERQLQQLLALLDESDVIYLTTETNQVLTTENGVKIEPDLPSTNRNALTTETGKVITTENNNVLEINASIK